MADRRLFFQMHRANRVLTSWVNARTIEEIGVSSAQLGTLYYVAKSPHCSMSDVAAELDINKSAMSGMIARLERAGLLERAPNPDDARGSLLTLTPRGEEVKTKSMSLVRKLQSELTAGFTEKEIDVVARFLASIVEKSP